MTGYERTINHHAFLLMLFLAHLGAIQLGVVVA